MARTVYTTLILSILAACAGRLSAWPGLESELKAYYERERLPEDHRCRHPRFEGVTQSRVVSEEDQQLVLEVRYFYSGGGGGGGSEGGGNTCRGFGRRTFTVAKTGDGYEVMGMTPSARDG